ncbi:acylphosphatase [Kosmotoga arenicorallina S304]|uniref:Acylphosphatase n=1 Tax=Kosmotoga arenicorallina S304 TaxID=1453497 RepID=A0A176K1H8_9BACT|nr:acylphosphatase [Kosmotoga arenicorallina]OAA30997.1 acylphosphatase [Kosmotoga arenicorallina S304]
MKTYHLLISGLVQGVGFRYFTFRRARKLGIKGYVRNTADGKVEIYASGPEERLEDFVTVVSRGPMYADVREVDKEELPYMPFDDFEIRP